MKLFSSEELRLYRAKLNITQKELAIRTGYSISYIQKLEQGTLEATPEFMKRLFMAYNIEENFRRSYERPHPKKFDWGGVFCYIVFILFIFAYMLINK